MCRIAHHSKGASPVITTNTAPVIIITTTSSVSVNQAYFSDLFILNHSVAGKVWRHFNQSVNEKRLRLTTTSNATSGTLYALSHVKPKFQIS